MEKIIHYCWFGGKPKPRQLKKYIKSWNKFLPEYKLMEWNENNFDVNLTNFSREAYNNKKWAFVSDVARVYALKEFGGIYFDTDIEIVKNIDNIIQNNIWLGKEDNHFLATAMFGVKEKHNIHFENIFNVYKSAKFDPDNLYSITSPRVFTTYFEKLGLKDGYDCQILDDDIHIYPRDYFNPKSYDGLNEMYSENTCIIHHFDASWTSLDEKIAIWFVRNHLGFMSKIVFAISNRIKKIKNKLGHTN